MKKVIQIVHGPGIPLTEKELKLLGFKLGDIVSVELAPSDLKDIQNISLE